MVSAANRSTLLSLARASIRYGLDHGRAPAIRLEDYPESLRAHGACFVTLQIDGALRGCIGALEPVRPLAEDVIHNAYAAAVSDPRFSPVGHQELERLDIHISILGPHEPLHFGSEAELLRQLRPGVDGLILQDGRHRGTFLPSVWEQLPEPKEFLRHLKMKAGLSPSHWSDHLRVERYTTESFG